MRYASVTRKLEICCTFVYDVFWNPYQAGNMEKKQLIVGLQEVLMFLIFSVDVNVEGDRLLVKRSSFIVSS